MSGEVGRRTVVKGAAWSLPVIAAAVAAPMATASTPTTERIPVSCLLLNGTGSPQYDVQYADGTHVTMPRHEVVHDDRLKEMCPVPARGNEG